MDKFLSRKLLAFIASSVVIPVMAMKGADIQIIQLYAGLTGVYLGGQSVVDAVGARKGGE